jgi:hypothetical protein
MTNSAVRLVATRVRFYSALDEDSFFSWLHRIVAVTRVSGESDRILIQCDPNHMTDEALREMVALFFRYGVATDQLDAFANSANSSWLLDSNAFWRRPPGR